MGGRSTLVAIAAGWLLIAACGEGETDDPPVDVAESHDVDWAATAMDFRGRVGERFALTCPAAGTAYTVWGTDTYTDDSSVCTAAVHAGEIDLADGGTVVIEMREGEDAYRGSARNGVTTLDYGEWPASFVFP